MVIFLTGQRSTISLIFPGMLLFIFIPAVTFPV